MQRNSKRGAKGGGASPLTATRTAPPVGGLLSAPPAPLPVGNAKCREARATRQRGAALHAQRRAMATFERSVRERLASEKRLRLGAVDGGRRHAAVGEATAQAGVRVSAHDCAFSVMGPRAVRGTVCNPRNIHQSGNDASDDTSPRRTRCHAIRSVAVVVACHQCAFTVIAIAIAHTCLQWCSPSQRVPTTRRTPPSRSRCRRRAASTPARRR